MDEKMMNQMENEMVASPSQPIIKNRIKKYLEKPKNRRGRKKEKIKTVKYERAFDKRMFRKLMNRSLRTNLLIGTGITLAVLLVFRYVLNFNLGSIAYTLMPFSFGLSVVLALASLIVLFKDKTTGLGSSDPVTDFFIIKKGRMVGTTSKRHLDRINTRFIMITLLKLFQKEQLAIVDERFVYGTMDGDLTKDETALLTFLLDHEIRTLDDFEELMTEESHGGKKKDLLYKTYKDAVIQMATEKHYVNQSINLSKLILRAGGILYGLITVALVAKGQGELVTLGAYAAQSAFLFFLANVTYANSKGAHQRIKALKKERKLLTSTKVEMVTSLIYNYMFNREHKVLKKVQKQFENGRMNKIRYQRFSESYNGFNYLMNIINNEQKEKRTKV